MWQAEFVRDRLQAAGVEVGLEVISTVGDRRLDVPLSNIGEKGLFTRELDDALLRGEIHLAVHSLKDLPSTLPEGLLLAAVPERESPLDAFIAHPEFAGGLADLRAGDRIATSSLRRQAQLRAMIPDVEIVSVRGNVDTRLRKLEESNWTGIILAEAGLTRLGFEDRIRSRIPANMMTPAVGQGALGVVSAASNEELIELLRGVLHHVPSGLATTAERAFLSRVEGGCSVPVAAYGVVMESSIVMSACVASLDGRRVIRERASGGVSDPVALGHALAERVLARGAGEILSEIRSQSPK